MDEGGKQRLVARILVGGAVRGGDVDVEEEVMDFTAHLLGHPGELVAIRHAIVIQDEGATRADLAGGNFLHGGGELDLESLRIDDFGSRLGRRLGRRGGLSAEAH